jgi:hypothetical protein
MTKMENPLRDPRIRACLIVAAFLIAAAYFALKDHVLFSKRHFGEEAPALTANIFGGIYAAAAVAVLWYACRLYRLNAASRKKNAKTQLQRPT